jgi:Pyruvate/2-oxoacid:ferredoxin oxidoreductase delta subunit
MPEEKRQYPENVMETYRQLLKHLGDSWYPVPQSADMLKMVMYRFTPEEAEFLVDFPLMPRSLDDIAAIKVISKEKLATKLDDLSRGGLLYRYTKGEKNYYYLQDSYSIWRTYSWPGPKGDNRVEIAGFMDHIFPEFMEAFRDVTEKGLRVLPLDHTVEDPKTIVPYEEVKKVLDSYTYFCVTRCGCREKKNLAEQAQDCKYPSEVCLHFDKLAHYAVENGLGREITKQEAADILRQCAEMGLVHGISNQQKGTDTICNCCKCCCMWFETMTRCKHLGTLTPSNYRIQVEQSSCTGCGLCVKRCPMEALSLVDDPVARGRKTTVTVDGKEKTLVNKTGKVTQAKTEYCIGCGVCAYKCPSRSLVLKRNEVEHHPPETGRDWMVQFISQSRGKIS